MRKRTWVITEELTHDDLEWVLRSKLSFTQGEKKHLDIISYGGSVLPKLPIMREPSTIITTTEKEETWLKLYFADRAILIAEEVMYK